MPSRPLAILHLVSSERWTGVADPVVSLASHQAKSGHAAWLACIGGYTFEEMARQRGVRIFTALTLDRRLHPPNLYADYQRLRRFVEEQRIDVIHTHLLHDHWLAALALRDHRAPHLLARTMHRFEWPRSDPFHKWLFRKRTDRILTTSDAMRRRIVARVGLAAGNIDIVFGGVDLQRFRPELDGAAIRSEFGIPTGAPVAGIVARLRDGRGHDWLLRTVPRILQAAPAAHFLIVGRGELKRALRARIAAMPDGPRVHMTGYRADDLPQVYAAMNCALFLGQGSEGSCRAILEAMACARPVVGADVGGVAEIIAEGRTGRVVAENDEAQLAQAVAELLNAPARAADMGRAARRDCEQRFTEEGRATQILAIYDTAWRLKYGAPL